MYNYYLVITINSFHLNVVVVSTHNTSSTLKRQWENLSKISDCGGLKKSVDR